MYNVSEYGKWLISLHNSFAEMATSTLKIVFTSYQLGCPRKVYCEDLGMVQSLIMLQLTHFQGGYFYVYHCAFRNGEAHHWWLQGDLPS